MTTRALSMILVAVALVTSVTARAQGAIIDEHHHCIYLHVDDTVSAAENEE